MKSLVLTFCMLATPALANFECAIDRQCGGGTCEAFTGGPLLLNEVGDVWQVSMDGTVWEGYSATTLTETGEVAIVIPPQQGMAGLISVYPSGEMFFTVHAFSGQAVAITGMGNCMAPGG